MTTEVVQENFLEKLRVEIDETDRVLLNTLLKRINIVKMVGEYKKIRGIPPLDESRWKKVLETRGTYAQSIGLNPKLVTGVFEILHTYALQIEREIK